MTFTTGLSLFNVFVLLVNLTMVIILRRSNRDADRLRNQIDERRRFWDACVLAAIPNAVSEPGLDKASQGGNYALGIAITALVERDKLFP